METDFRKLTEELKDYFMEEQYELGTTFEDMHALYARAFTEGLITTPTYVDAEDYYRATGEWKKEE